MSESTNGSPSASLPANTVQVWPGGTTFKTIQSAIDSIKDASPQLQYQVAVGPGTYNENVNMKDHVHILGAGQEQTIITARAQNEWNGVVNSAVGCSISGVTINALGGKWGNSPTCIKLCGDGDFRIKGVTMNATDGGVEGNNVRVITNNTGSMTSNLTIGQSIMRVTAGNRSTSIGIEFAGNFGKCTAFLNLVSMQISGPSTYGVVTAVGSTVTLHASKVIASTFSLYNSDRSGPITANQCTIDGPVSDGVTVNP